jgi:shikimate dehydrogenase
MGGLQTGLIGWPVAHSLSPAMHNTAFRELGIAGEYNLHPITPQTLERDFTALSDNAIKGLNITIPHKQTILNHPMIEHACWEVKAIGAANTLLRTKTGNWYAENTDWRGALNALQRQHIPLSAETQALILGTGGAAQALAFALKQADVESIRFASREPQNRDHHVDYTQVGDFDFDLIVNCTPLGLPPSIGASPWPENIPFPKRAALFDLIYTPAQTRLMQTARETGAQVIGGLDMLIEQARLSFELWTGVLPEYGIMESAAKQALKLWHD